MKNTLYFILVFAMIYVLGSCRPYKHGPIMNQKNIQKTFTPLIQAFGLKPGTVYADIGAQNGLYDVAFATLTQGVTYYIQDIDQAALKELDRVLRYYTKKSGRPIAQDNQFHSVLGTTKQTNLPDDTFDVIHSNATFHAIRHKRAIIQDIFTKLKPGGYFFIRDEFVKNGVVKWCPSKECNARLATEEELLAVMATTDFKLVKKYPDYDGYPMYKFQRPE